MKRFIVSNILAFAALVFFNGCPKNDNNPVTPDGSGTINFGTVTVAGNGYVGSGGGSVQITTGDLTGFKIDVPSGAYRTGCSFSISEAAISSHTFGADFHPITPLIRIDNGGAYADSVMTLTIPCEVPQGHFAMGFYYDEQTGELEGIPVVAINDHNVVLATRHFSGTALQTVSKGIGVQAAVKWVDLLVSSVQADKLFEAQESGFHPGIDDWEFTNYGSYIANFGHCTGQSLTAMWYFSAHKLALKEAPLNGRFNTTAPKIWQADRNGYRFASVVWADQTPNLRQAWLQKFENQGTTRFSRDSLHYLAFAYSIHLTKQPQLTEIWNNSGGHAMIVYRASGRVLSIADPNYPGSYSHFITLGSNGHFDPYPARLNATAADDFYPIIHYIAKSSLFSAELVKQRYAEMMNNTIGDYPPNNFPNAELLWYSNGEWVTAPDTINTDQDTIMLAARCQTCATVMPGQLTRLYQLGENKDTLAKPDANGYIRVALKAAQNKLPIYVDGKPNNGVWSFVDFKTLVVNKVITATFEYWLRGVDENGDSVGFGAKDGTIPFPGRWSGTTFHVDTTLYISENGNSYAVKELMTAVSNASHTQLSSFNVELSLQGMKMISLDGTNLALTTSDNTYYTFGAQGLNTCSHLSRVYFDFWGKVKSWFCDEESFITFKIPKP